MSNIAKVSISELKETLKFIASIDFRKLIIIDAEVDKIDNDKKTKNK